MLICGCVISCLWRLRSSWGGKLSVTGDEMGGEKEEGKVEKRVRDWFASM